ncbi:MAG: hypothetical protein IJQ82_02420 [Selenomonadaceae bacterium]|nr:hypothetical protein [Selenomonadaceae bacterium]
MSKIGNIANKILDVQTIKIDDIIKQYGGVVTINGLSYATYKGDSVPVFNFVEGEGTAFWGGCKKLRELAAALEEEYKGDLSAINEDFRHTGIKVKISPLTKTNGGNPFRPVAKLGLVEFENVDESEFDEPEVDTETGEVVKKEPF